MFLHNVIAYDEPSIEALFPHAVYSVLNLKSRNMWIVIIVIAAFFVISLGSTLIARNRLLHRIEALVSLFRRSLLSKLENV